MPATGWARGFLDQDPVERLAARGRHQHYVGTLYLRAERAEGRWLRAATGKVLLTGSIAGFIPGSFQAVYNGTKAFVDSFADALRAERD